MLAIAEFQKWRNEKIEALGLEPPCDIPPDDEGLAIIAKHKKAAKAAMKIMRQDSRLGYHQEPHYQFFDVDMIKKYLAT
jgi:hypothetical protein